MNYYAAREKLAAGGNRSGVFHYTCENDGRIWPVGFCAQGCAGHGTKEEAEEHYRQYLLSIAVFKGPAESRWPKHKCESEGCNAEATHLADIPGHMEFHQFCEQHCNRDELAKLVHVGECASSY